MNFKRVVIGVPSWDDSSTCRYAAGVASGLKAAGLDPRILITQPQPSLGRELRELPDGIIVESLPRTPLDRLSDVWLSLIRHLEENAPAVYISNQDWVASLICPRLSNRVQVIGVLHEDSPLEYEHCERLGSFWNAIVVRDPALRQRIIGEYPEYAARLAGFSTSSNELDELSLGREYAALIANAGENIRSGKYRRRQKKMQRPPSSIAPDLSQAQGKTETRRVNIVPLWPDQPIVHEPIARRKSSGRPLSHHRIVIAVPTGRVSGVDVFSINLARELIRQGFKAELVQTEVDAPVADRLPLPDDIPVYQLQTRPFPTWRDRWSAMQQHLESRGPCIYLPNYDDRHSCIIPTLSDNVKVVGIGHSDDSQHYSHILHLSRYWDAIVGVSDAITQSIAAMAPGIEPRQYTIPYGVQVPPMLPERRSDTDGKLRLVYTGRIVRFQKRALDLVSIAQTLQADGADVELTVAGSGTELTEFVGYAGHFLLNRSMRYVGALTNDDVLQLLDDSDVFVLPSAFEGLPVSLLEAMAHGCVPLVTDIRSGVPQIIRNDDNGFLVPIGGIREFADRISMLAADRCAVDRIRRSAYETVKADYSVEKMTASYVNVFEQIVSSPYARPKGRVMPPPSLQGVQALMPRFPMAVRRAVWAIRGTGP